MNINPDPPLPILDGMSQGQARVALRMAVASGLNMTRAQALILANRKRDLRTAEKAELDQMLARLNESCLQVKATSKPAPTRTLTDREALFAKCARMLRAADDTDVAAGPTAHYETRSAL